MSSLKLILTPKQKEAVKLMGLCEFMLLEGGSRSGKTFLIMRNMIIRAMHHANTWHLATRLRFKHAKQSIWRQTLPALVKLMDLERNNHYTTDESDLLMKFYNGSTIMIGGLDDKERVEKVLGNEYATIFVNESSQIAYDSIETLMTRLNPPKKVPPRFWFDYNPPSKHHWGYKIFHDRVFPDGRPVPEGDYKWIRLNPEDNRDNISDTLFYTLNNLSGSKRKRFLKGEYGSDDGALWKRRWIGYKPAPKDLIRVVVGVDPSGSLEGNEIGIIVVGIDREGIIYVLYDGSLQGSPKEWSDEVNYAYGKYKADVVAAEKNFGGEMVAAVITQFDLKNVNVKLVNASRGKAVRAEPVAALYEKQKVFHVEQLVALEDEICTWKPADKESPNRMDALVWGITELKTGDSQEAQEEEFQGGVDAILDNLDGDL